MSLLPIVLMFVLLYFLMIRPQMKRAKEHKAMIEALQKGDEVVTAGGVARHASPRSATTTSRLEIAANTEISVQKRRGADAAAQGHDQDAVDRRNARSAHRLPMNRYPALEVRAGRARASSLGLLYTLPNFFGESPAVQVSSVTRHGQGRHRAAGARRGRAQAGRHRHTGAAARRDSVTRALRRHRHPAQGEGR